MSAAVVPLIQTLPGFPLFFRQADGTYLNLIYGVTSVPFPLLSPLNDLAQWLSPGLKTLLATPAAPAGTGTQTQLYSLADVDGNGTKGFASADGSAVLVRRSTATTELGSQIYNIGPDVNSTFLADFNKDGKPDLAVAFDGSTTVPGGIAVLINRGDGTFGSPVIYARGTQATRFAVLDLNDDGALDIATAQLGGGVKVLLGKGDGTFGSAVPYGVGSASAGSGSGQAIAIADFNRDGIPDIVAGGATGVLLGNGDGSFRVGKPLPAVAGGNFVWAFAAGDLDGDGNMDLVYSDIQNQVAAALLGNGDGTFRAGQTYDLDVQPDSLLLADINHDGHLDIINGTGDQRILGPGDNSGGMDILLNNGDGTFAGVPTSFSLPNAESSDSFNDQRGLAVANFGRTFPGMLVSAQGELTFFQGDGKGGFQAPQAIALSGQAGAIAAGDFNGDGLTDAAVVTGSSITILPGGAGGFGNPVTSSTGISFATVMVSGDFDHDGNTDLAVAGPGSIAILLGKGDGTFQTPVMIAAGPAPTAMALADLSGDGKPDLVIADSGNNGVGGAVYLAVNMGGGAFHAPATLYSGFYPVFGIGDVDRDGKLDLVVSVQAGEGESLVSWLPGNGGGSFRAPVAITTSLNPNVALLLQDFNGDGNPDIVLGNEGQTTTFMFGNGDGTFSAEVPFLSAAQTQNMYLATADLNGDGKPDLVVAGLTISVLLNSGQPTAVTIQTNPPGLPFYVDNDAAQPAPQTLSLSQGPHFISVGTPSAGAAGTQYIFTGWSDGGAAEHTIAVGPSAAAYTANFTASGGSGSPAILSVTTADGGAAIAENTFIVIKGTNLVPPTTAANGVIWSTAPSFAAGLMPTQLGGVSVTVNNKPAFVYFFCSAATDSACSQDQLNILTPLDSTVGPVSVVVASGTGTSAPFTVTMQAQTPAFLLFGATQYIAATHAGNALIGPASLYPGASTPAQPSEEIQLYAVGFGLPSTALVNDSAMQSGSLPALPVCTVGGSAAVVDFAGLIGPGLYQLNVTIPAGAASGDNSVSCTYNGASTPAGDLITVQN